MIEPAKLSETIPSIIETSDGQFQLVVELGLLRWRGAEANGELLRGFGNALEALEMPLRLTSVNRNHSRHLYLTLSAPKLELLWQQANDLIYSLKKSKLDVHVADCATLREFIELLLSDQDLPSFPLAPISLGELPEFDWDDALDLHFSWPKGQEDKDAFTLNNNIYQAHYIEQYPPVVEDNFLAPAAALDQTILSINIDPHQVESFTKLLEERLSQKEELPDARYQEQMSDIEQFIIALRNQLTKPFNTSALIIVSGASKEQVISSKEQLNENLKAVVKPLHSQHAQATLSALPVAGENLQAPTTRTLHTQGLMAISPLFDS
jgi:hypothetical protein